MKMKVDASFCDIRLKMTIVAKRLKRLRDNTLVKKSGKLLFLRCCAIYKHIHLREVINYKCAATLNPIKTLMRSKLLKALEMTIFLLHELKVCGSYLKKFIDSSSDSFASLLYCTEKFDKV